MKKDNLYNSLEAILNETLDIAKSSSEKFFLSDMYINIDLTNFKISIFDDIFAKIIVRDVSDLKDVENSKYVERTLKDILNRLKQIGRFKELDIIEPFSVSVINNENEVESVLMIIDEDKELIDNDFLKNMDKDLENFISNLIS